MKKYLLKIYDENIKTNYIERVITAIDLQEALESILSDDSVKTEAIKKFSKSTDILNLINRNCFDYLEVL